jgi:hypothetical protein
MKKKVKTKICYVLLLLTALSCVHENTVDNTHGNDAQISLSIGDVVNSYSDDNANITYDNTLSYSSICGEANLNIDNVTSTNNFEDVESITCAMRFGYVNMAGSRIIVPNERVCMCSGACVCEFNGGIRLAYFEYAVGATGILHHIEHAGFQERNEHDNSRQNMWNFDNEAGNVYNVLNTVAIPNDTYMLFTQDWHENNKFLPKVEHGINSTISSEMLEMCKELSGREIRNAWLLSEHQDNIKISMVEFEPINNSLLAWLVVEVDEVFKYCEFPAELNEWGNWGWKVDDHGTLEEYYFDILSVIQCEQKKIVYLVWFGYEVDVVIEIKFYEDGTINEKVVFSRYIFGV